MFRVEPQTLPEELRQAGAHVFNGHLHFVFPEGEVIKTDVREPWASRVVDMMGVSHETLPAVIPQPEVPAVVEVEPEPVAEEPHEEAVAGVALYLL